MRCEQWLSVDHDVTDRLAKFAPKLPQSHGNHSYEVEGGTMRGLHNSFFDPPTLAVPEVAFDEAWLTLKSIDRRPSRCSLP
ncbi:MAG TPA: hypothetical protein VGU64_07855 [Terriglobales bacterium]|jgi:hypothetical protein|nr:hypothetical protein [Terriglobales bacterium]